MGQKSLKAPSRIFAEDRKRNNRVVRPSHGCHVDKSVCHRHRNDGVWTGLISLSTWRIENKFVDNERKS